MSGGDRRNKSSLLTENSNERWATCGVRAVTGILYALHAVQNAFLLLLSPHLCPRDIYDIFRYQLNNHMLILSYVLYLNHLIKAGQGHC